MATVLFSRLRFDADKIAALLNKIPDASDTDNLPKAQPAPKQKARSPVKPARGRASGRDAVMSANEIDAFKAQVSRCWNPPVGGLGARSIRVKMRITFNKDGTLSRPPRLMNSGDGSFFQAAADSAIRAVWQCQPYNMPSAKFDQWGDMILNFDPREMFGGF